MALNWYIKVWIFNFIYPNALFVIQLFRIIEIAITFWLTKRRISGSLYVDELFFSRIKAGMVNKLLKISWVGLRSRSMTCGHLENVLVYLVSPYLFYWRIIGFMIIQNQRLLSCLYSFSGGGLSLLTHIRNPLVHPIDLMTLNLKRSKQLNIGMSFTWE